MGFSQFQGMPALIGRLCNSVWFINRAIIILFYEEFSGMTKRQQKPTRPFKSFWTNLEQLKYSF